MHSNSKALVEAGSLNRVYWLSAVVFIAVVVERVVLVVVVVVVEIICSDITTTVTVTLSQPSPPAQELLAQCPAGC